MKKRLLAFVGIDMSEVNLPPLPDHDRHSWAASYSALQMYEFATAAVLAEREKCAELFRALERSDQSVADHIEAAVMAERERCALACEGVASVCEASSTGVRRSAGVGVANTIAALIRGGQRYE